MGNRTGIHSIDARMLRKPTVPATVGQMSPFQCLTSCFTLLGREATWTPPTRLRPQPAQK